MFFHDFLFFLTIFFNNVFFNDFYDYFSFFSALKIIKQSSIKGHI